MTVERGRPADVQVFKLPARARLRLAAVRKKLNPHGDEASIFEVGARGKAILLPL